MLSGGLLYYFEKEASKDPSGEATGACRGIGHVVTRI